MARLDEAYQLGAVFTDQLELSFIRPALANWYDLRSIEQGCHKNADICLLNDAHGQIQRAIEGASQSTR